MSQMHVTLLLAAVCACWLGWHRAREHDYQGRHIIAQAGVLAGSEPNQTLEDYK